jgi:hypothetical protein
MSPRLITAVGHGAMYLFGHNSLGLDLHQYVRIDQSFDLHHRSPRLDCSKYLSVRATDFRPVINVDQIYTSANDIGERSSGLLQC